MVVNPLSPDVESQARSLILHAREAVSVVPERLKGGVQDIVSTLENYLESDEGQWPEYRQSVPWPYVYREFASRINMWRDNKVISFQNDDAPKSSMAERAMATLADGGFPSYVIHGNVGIHVSERATEAITYLDNHFLAHPYSAITGADDSVVFTILDSRYYPADSYDKSESGTLVLTTSDLRNRIVEFASENEMYASHLETVIGE